MSSTTETQDMMGGHQAASSFAMIRTLAGIAVAAGVLLSLVYQGTYGIIQSNRQEQVRRAVFKVLPDLPPTATPAHFAVNTETEDMRPIGEDEEVPGGYDRVYAGYDETGRLVGLALPASAQGYGDVIRGLYGYDPAEEELTGLTILESKETPGLGDRIMDESFLRSFKGMDVRLDAEGEGLANPIEWVESSTKTEPWQVDGISGATVSTQAVARMMRESAERFIPVIRDNLPAFRKDG